MFELTDETKKSLQEISATFTSSVETVREVWEYTVFTFLLKYSECKDKSKFFSFDIPFFGKLFLKKSGEVVENGSLVPNLEPYLSLSEDFKKMLQKVQDNSFEDLSKYVEQKYLSRLSENNID